MVLTKISLIFYLGFLKLW